MTKSQVLWLLRHYGLFREGLRPPSSRATGYTDFRRAVKGGYIRPPSFIVNAEKAADLYLRLEKLPPPMSVVLILVYSYGFTWQEIARLLHTDDSTLHRQGQEAIETLR